MKTIYDLPKTTFSGRRFTRKQLVLVQELTEMFGNLSRKELAQTICEQLEWTTPNGKNKINSCLTLLEGLETAGVISLPAKRVTRKPQRRLPSFTEPPATQPIKGSLGYIGPVTLQKVISKTDREAWKAYLQTYHYLGYKHPVGSHLGYFIVAANGRKLGCLLFSASAAWALAPRDKWIGWDKKHRTKLLHLVLSNDRFLIFPWIDIPNLASHSLSLAIKQIGDDWQKHHGYRPMLIETFVDSSRYTGACYKAANWHYLGKTKGRGRFDPKHECQQTKKDIYIYPLQPDWKEALTTYPRAASTHKRGRDNSPGGPCAGDSFIGLWRNVVEIFHEVAQEYDDKWRVRRRIIDSKMLILLIFRMVSSQNSQSYGSTIDDLWDNCRKLKIDLPQEKSIAPSSLCNARKKLDENIFKCLNRKILDVYAHEELNDTWQGHRLFAVDGSKINVPRELKACGYKTPAGTAQYPQGLLSCLYQVHARVPIDFTLVAHSDERKCAHQHMGALRKDDVVVYDRGYYSFSLLYEHHKAGVHAIFRLQKSSATVIDEFIKSAEDDTIVTIFPSRTRQKSIRKNFPHIDLVPIKIRLIKYEAGGNPYYLGTTLVEPEQQYPIQDFKDAYHARWGVEELYKVSKQIIDVQDFHSRSERGVRQELYAHFVLITMNRLFANQADNKLNTSGGSPFSTESNQSVEYSQTLQENRANFKNCFHVIMKNLEELLLSHGQMDKTINRVFGSIIGRHQKVRPGRSYPRISMKPESKWRPARTRGSRIKKEPEAARAP